MSQIFHIHVNSEAEVIAKITFGPGDTMTINSYDFLSRVFQEHIHFVCSPTLGYSSSVTTTKV